jgi:hypothetical protein
MSLDDWGRPRKNPAFFPAIFFFDDFRPVGSKNMSSDDWGRPRKNPAFFPHFWRGERVFFQKKVFSEFGLGEFDFFFGTSIPNPEIGCFFGFFFVVSMIQKN